MSSHLVCGPQHFDVFNPFIQQFRFVGGVEVDNKDRSDQSDHREGNRNLCAAVFSFFIHKPPTTERESYDIEAVLRPRDPALCHRES